MIIVTGGTHGIGRACVQRLAGEGEDVLFTGADDGAGRALAVSLPNTQFVPGDVTREADCATVVEAAMRGGNGRLKGLVNIAGTGRRLAFADSGAQDWDDLLRTNARSSFLFTRLALAGLRAGRGAVVNVASVAGRTGEDGMSLHSASKAALIAMTQALALELGDEVRLNVICPGRIDTRMTGAVEADDRWRQRPEIHIPTGRLGLPEEVADVAIWLLNSQSACLNGAVIMVDGGESAGSRMISPDPG